MSPVDTAKQGAFRDWMQKAHPTSTIIEKQREVSGRLPYASRLLTYATGGGPPFGHWVREYGPEGSGKSLSNLGMIYVGQNYPAVISEQYELLIKHFERVRNKLVALKLKREMNRLVARFPDGLDFCVFDTEQRFEEAFAERLGIDMGRVELIDENIVENIVDQMKQAVEAYHVVIIDSVSNAQSMMEAGLAPGEYEQGSAAQAWKRLRQVRRKMDRSENIVIFVDQVRMQLGRGPGGPRSQPKAQPSQIRFLKHNISIDIEFEAGGKLYLDDNGVITDDYDKASNTYKALGVNAKEIAGLDIRGRVNKQSTGKAFRPYRMRFAFDMMDNKSGELIQEVAFDEEFELLEVGIDFGIIEKSAKGGRYVVLDDDGDETDQRAHGAHKMRAIIKEDEELRERILTRLLLATGDKVR